MKKLLLSLLVLFGLGFSFCSAKLEFPFVDYDFPVGSYTETNGFFKTYYLLNPAPIGNDITITFHIDDYSFYENGVQVNKSLCYSTIYTTYQNLNYPSYYSRGSLSIGDKTSYFSQQNNPLYAVGFSFYPCGGGTYSGNIKFSVDFNTDSLFYGFGNSSCSLSSIDVLYNNENSIESVVCNGDNVIQIDGLSTITATHKFTPYFNISYKDEDNQSLIESYSKNILYLSGGLYKKTYTGNNDWVLSVQNLAKESDSFSGFIPTFDVVFTGEVWEDTGNVFNNFAENSIKMLFSNIPNYIQYVIMLLLLFFILGIIRKIRGRR